MVQQISTLAACILVFKIWKIFSWIVYFYMSKVRTYHIREEDILYESKILNLNYIIKYEHLKFNVI